MRLPWATLLKDGRVLLTGGFLGGLYTDPRTTFGVVFDPKNESYQNIGHVPIVYFHTATLLSSGKVLIIGEPSPTTIYANGTWIAKKTWVLEFDPRTNQFAKVAELIVPRLDKFSTEPTEKGCDFFKVSQKRV